MALPPPEFDAVSLRLQAVRAPLSVIARRALEQGQLDRNDRKVLAKARHLLRRADIAAGGVEDPCSADPLSSLRLHVRAAVNLCEYGLKEYSVQDGRPSKTGESERIRANADETSPFETAQRLVPIGSTIVTDTFGPGSVPDPWTGVVTGHRVAVDGEHSVIDILGPGRCSECIQYPWAVYIQYTCPSHPLRRNEPVNCGLHFYGENDPHVEGRRIVEVISDP